MTPGQVAILMDYLIDTAEYITDPAVRRRHKVEREQRRKRYG